MRSFRSLIILFVVFAGIIGYLYFVDAKKPVEQEDQKAKLFAGVDADAIDSLRISTIAGGVATLQKGADGWKITAPSEAKADESEVSSVTGSLASLTLDHVVDENPASLGDYGLKEPVVEIGFKTRKDKAEHTLQVGTKTATGNDLYAKLANEKKVFLIPGYLEQTFTRQPFDLRDKRILVFDRDKADRVEVTSGDSTVTLVKSAGDWRLAAPVDARGDFAGVEGLVTRLQSVQMKSIVSEHAADLTQYGLDKPTTLATVGLGSARAGLAIGGKTDKGDLYVRDVTRDMVVTVAPDLLTDLQKSATDLRRKDVFDFRPYNLTRIELTRGADTIAIERLAGKGKDGTDLWQNATTRKALDGPKVEAFLTRLSGLRASSFADPKARTGLDQPVLAVKASFEDGKKTESARFGRLAPDVFSGRPDEPGAMKLDAAEFDGVIKDLDAFK